MSIKIGILGYGNLGRGVECAVKQNEDMELAAVFTRRDPETVQILTEGVPVCRIADAAEWKDKIDVMILCGGSATDLPVQTLPPDTLPALSYPVQVSVSLPVTDCPDEESLPDE